jgi:predicted lipoprotein with Yx(FWY)xxD motif
MNALRFSIGLIILLIAAVAFAVYTPASSAFQATPGATMAATVAATRMASPAATMSGASMAGALKIAQHPTLGAYLTDMNGRALYLFTRDTTPNTSTCTGSCAQTWPAFTGQAMMAGTPSAPMTGTVAATRPATAAATSPALATVAGTRPATAAATMAATVAATRPATVAATAAAPMTGTVAATRPATVAATMAAPGTAAAAATVNPALLTMITNPNGGMMMSYNGHPLYYFNQDTAPGDTKGQGVGGVWFLVSPAGNGIGMGAVTPGAATPAGGASPAASPTR